MERSKSQNMVNQLPNMRGIHPRRYAKINWKQEFKSLTQRDKIFPYISWECCHHQFQDFEASFFPVEYSFAHLLFVSEVFKVNFDRE